MRAKQSIKPIGKERHGISTIVSSLLMLLITIIAFSTVLAYTNNFISAQRRTQLATIRERIVVEDIWFQLNNTITIYITNVGTVPLKIIEIHINNENVVFNPPTLRLGIFEIGPVQFSYGWISGSEYSFLVVTEGGYFVEVSATAP